MRTLFTLLLAVSLQAGLYAQTCTPLNPFPYEFIYPLPYQDGVPGSGITDTALVNVPFETVFQIQAPSEFTFNGVTLPVISFSLATTGAIAGLPPGLTYACNPPNCVFNALTPACVSIYGVTDQAGIYDLEITGTLVSILPIPVSFPDPAIFPGNYYLHVQDCPAITNSQTLSVCAGSDLVMPDGSVLTDIQDTLVQTSVLQGANGCDSTITTTVVPDVVDVAVSLNGTTLEANAGSGLYQWIDCATNQPLAGETNASFTPLATGNYAVAVTTPGGCADTSVCTTLVINSLWERDNDFALSLSPNPASEQIRIELPLGWTEAVITLRDIRGDVFRRQAASNLVLDVSGLAPGIYILTADTPDGRAVARVVIGK